MPNKFQEYEHEPVPLTARKNLFSVAVIWAGFPMVMVGAFVGAQIVTGLGFIKGLVAIILGNLILAIYVGALSALAAKEGKTFALSCQNIFGIKGAKFVSTLLATLVVGWFAVQTGLAAHTLNSILHFPLFVATLSIGLIFTALSMLGIKILKPISVISIILFIGFGVWSSLLIFKQVNFQDIWQFQPEKEHSLAFGIGLTMAISVFVDSGTLTADFTRWSKNAKEGVLASCAAFPFANMLPMLFGALCAASLMAADGNFATIIAKLGPVWSVLAVLFFVINCASVATHGLYNAASGWSVLLNCSFRSMVVVFGVIGTLIAVAGINDILVNWLSLLGVVVPGVGGAIMGWMVTGAKHFVPKQMIMSWGVSIIFSALSYLYFPEYSVAVISILSAFIMSIILIKSSRLS